MRMASSISEIEIPTPQGSVFGDLHLPAAPKLAALFIGGSGPHDRAGKTPRMTLGYDLWAKAWAAQDMAVLCLDKPGSGSNPLPTERPVRYAYDLIRNQAALDALGNTHPDLPLAVIGHSLGALTALELTHDRLRGLAHLCGAGRTLDRVICDQVLKVLSEQQAPQDAIETHLAERLNVYQTFARGEVLKELPPWAGEDVEALIYIGDCCRHDPIRLLGDCPLPICQLMGTEDQNLFEIDWKLTRAAAPKAPALLVEGMDHFFKMPDGSLNADVLKWVGEQILEFAKA